LGVWRGLILGPRFMQRWNIKLETVKSVNEGVEGVTRIGSIRFVVSSLGPKMGLIFF
jgi:hypothetical protein